MLTKYPKISQQRQHEEKTPLTAIIMAHGFGAIKTMGLEFAAGIFCQAGFDCLVFDYRHFGESSGEPRQYFDLDLQLEDWFGAIAHVREQNAQASQKIILWGASLSGGHVLEIAARDQDIAAVIAQCPFTNGVVASLTGHWLSNLKVTWAAIKDTYRKAVNKAPVKIAIAGLPGTTALISAPDALYGYSHHFCRDRPFDNSVHVRNTPRLFNYFPGRRASQLSCPVLFSLCEKDTVAPARPAQRYAHKTPLAVVKSYPFNHFEVYGGMQGETIARDQVGFLTSWLSDT